METKVGRERIYSIKPLEGFKNQEAAFAAAYMDELRERVYDQIEDLPQEALDYVSGQTQLSIGRLGVHLAWAEASWVCKMLGEPIPADLKPALDPGALNLFDRPPAKTGGAAEIIALCRRVEDQVTKPYLREVTDVDRVVLDNGSTIRGVIMHLQWHWGFHSGHIGLLRFECHSDYTWTKAFPMAPQLSL